MSADEHVCGDGWACLPVVGHERLPVMADGTRLFVAAGGHTNLQWQVEFS